jgi:hypothetical protein
MWLRFHSPDNLHILLASSKTAITRAQAQDTGCFGGALLQPDFAGGDLSPLRPLKTLPRPAGLGSLSSPGGLAYDLTNPVSQLTPR